ncbi:DNA primase [Streptomyces sp. NPDC057651]|uniref:DNA primase n=1 Tax=unclassified Streptomyces TaxID=2593676 RepID=UPI003691E929
MHRAAIGLAVGAGYVLGRTKKMKLAFAVGTLVAGKRLRLKDALGILDSPQFKEIGDQLREDLAGVGKAATGALVERRMEGLAGALHDRTEGVRDRIDGVTAPVGRHAAGDDDSGEDDRDRDDGDDRGDRDRVPAQRSGAGRSAGKRSATKQSATKKPAAKKPAGKKAASKSASKSTAAPRTASRRVPRTPSKGGRDDD